MLGDSTRPVFLSPGFWWIATALLSTYAVVDAHLGHLTSVFERVAVAVPLGWAVSSWLAYLFASLRYQTLDVRSVRAAWLVQAAIGLFHVWLVQRRRKAGHEPAGTMRDSPARSAKVAPHGPGMGFTALTALIVWPMVSSRFLRNEPDGSVSSGGATWADLPFHMNIAASFLYGTNREFDYRRTEAAFYAGSRLVYPLLPDFHAACLRVSGMSWRMSFLLPALFLAVSASALLYAVNWRLTGSRAAAVLSVLLVMCAGGTGSFEHWIERGWSHATRVAWDVDPVQADREGGRQEILWFAYFGHVFLPQRPATYAIPLILIVILLLVLAMTEGVPLQQSAIVLRLAAFVAGILPLFQAHAFVGAVILCSVLFIMDFDRWYTHMDLLWRGWLTAAFIGLALSAPQLPVYIGRVASSREQRGFLRFSWTAMSSFNSGFWRTWFRALTLHVPVYTLVFGIVSVVLLAQALADLERLFGVRGYFPIVERIQNRVVHLLRGLAPAFSGPSHYWRLKFFPAFAAVFVFCNLFLIPPWVKDNVKLVYIWLFQAAGVVGYLLVRLWRRGGPLGKLLTPLILFFMIFSGLLGIRREWGGVTAELFTPAHQEVGEWIKANTHLRSVFLTNEGHSSPACALAGRTLYSGHLGWVWSHGLRDCYEREQFQDELLRGEGRNGTELLNQLRYLRVSHILLEPEISDPEFEGVFDESDVWLGYENQGWRLYFIKDVVLDDRPIESISREQLYFSTGVSLVALWMAAMCMWYFPCVFASQEIAEDGNDVVPRGPVADRHTKTL